MLGCFHSFPSKSRSEVFIWLNKKWWIKKKTRFSSFSDKIPKIRVERRTTRTCKHSKTKRQNGRSILITSIWMGMSLRSKRKRDDQIFHSAWAWLRLLVEKSDACFAFIFVGFKGFRLIRVVCLIIVDSSNNSIMSGLTRFFCNAWYSSYETKFWKEIDARSKKFYQKFRCLATLLQFLLFGSSENFLSIWFEID